MLSNQGPNLVRRWGGVCLILLSETSEACMAMPMAIPTRSRAKARPGTVLKKAVGTATLALETDGAAKAWWRFLMTVGCDSQRSSSTNPFFFFS
jgi:hypothetical protein